MPVMSQSSPCLWTQLPQSRPSPCDRYKHACCSYDGHVYILGGRENSCLRDFWRYSVVCNEWTELSCTGEAAPEELEEHTMVAHEGFLYVFGGMLDSAYTKWRCSLWVFDIAKQKWVHSQGKKSSPQTQMPSNRKGHSAVVLGSDMLLYGGFVDMKGSSQEFWRLDFDTMKWSMLSSSQQASSGPGPRHSHSAMAYQSCMYLFGGLKGLHEQRDLWRWNSTNCTWSSLKNKSGPSRLMGHSAVVYKDSMLLFGGGRSQNSPKNSLYRYNFTSQTWTQVPILLGSTPPDKIHHCCVGLGPSYMSSTSSSSSEVIPRLLDDKTRPFKNKCFPAPLTFLGSDGAIEMETFSLLDRCYTRLTPASELDNRTESLLGKEAQRTGNCLSFENKAFKKQWSCTEEELLQEEEEDGDIAQHLPDLLLVLGGRPCATHSPISIWQMTLSES
ncbi:ras guanine nucleotide exchange factor F [Notolabrus celidotus]|uniref:ras guanine nucleotide exchange factor F n=1 Tax=Notolabrus celidotus TaxID=1203425 RepID=UPI001490669C|nr:ras guanine nucleotide exchange factor F [Notolabrus celidotus]